MILVKKSSKTVKNRNNFSGSIKICKSVKMKNRISKEN